MNGSLKVGDSLNASRATVLVNMIITDRQIAAVVTELVKIGLARKLTKR